METLKSFAVLLVINFFGLVCSVGITYDIGNLIGGDDAAVQLKSAGRYFFFNTFWLYSITFRESNNCILILYNPL